MQVHVDRSGARYGPYNLEEVNDYLASGILLPTDLAWQDGMTGWKPIGQIPGVVMPGGAVTSSPLSPSGAESQGVPIVKEVKSKKKALISIGAGAGLLALLAGIWISFIREDESKAPSTHVASPVKKTGEGDKEQKVISTLKPTLSESPTANATPVKPHILVSPSHDLRTVIEEANHNTIIKLTPGVFHLRALKPYGQGILIQNKRGLIIMGSGRDKTTIKLAPDVDVGFFIGTNVAGLKIENLHIQGTPPLKTNTAGIGNNSGTTNTRNIILTNLKVDHVAVGIFLATNNGVIRDVRITNNIVSHTVGTEAGWGYGIHTRKIGNVLIANNFIEHATRHSIYVRESPPQSTMIIDDNFILNHDLYDKNPRWYCAALNFPENHASSRIANNIFVNPKAVGISLMTTADDLTMFNNQIIGEHYVGIWSVTGEAHTVFANPTILHPKPPNPKWCQKTSNYDWANGKKTESRLNPPKARWNEPDYVCHLDGSLYAMKDGLLDRITPHSWSYKSSPKKWTDVKGMCAVENVRNGGDGRLYVVTGSRLFEVNPNNWESKFLVGDWSGAQFVAATRDRVHILNNGTLHSINLTSLEIKTGKNDWAAAQWMCAWGDNLYIFDGQAHHRIAPDSFESVPVSQ
ncbi:MAG: GYF domain-containing protein [Verrucomicrobiota bacterium]|jgi:hypothetical protein|nr:GYF domain-containing protein [Verrucomicrobiota bacterium]